MIFETKLINQFQADIYYPSPLPGFNFSIGEGGFITYKTSDPYNMLARYSEIIFLPGREEFKHLENSNVLTQKLYPGEMKLKIRSEWIEPSRTWPAVWFLNLTECPIVTVTPDALNQSNQLKLFMHIPVLSSVPCYSQFAGYRKYTIYPPVKQQSQMIGSIAGADFHEIEDNRLESPRSAQEMERLKRRIKEWKEEQKNAIRLM